MATTERVGGGGGGLERGREREREQERQTDEDGDIGTSGNETDKIHIIIRTAQKQLCTIQS